MIRSRRSSHRIRKPDYATPWDLERISYFLVGFYFVLSICILYLFLRFPGLNIVWFWLFKLTTLCASSWVMYLLWINRYYIPYILSSNPLKFLLQPVTDSWLFNNGLYVEYLKNQVYCLVPNICIVNSKEIAIAVLPSLANKIDSDEMFNELNVLMNQHGIYLTAYDGYFDDNGWYHFLLHRDKKEDQLNLE